MMSSQTYYDVAAGKPLTYLTPAPEQISHVVDLLWVYRFSWVILDRWTSREVEVELQNENEPNPLSSLEYSLDGKDFYSLSVENVVVLSNKGSRGTHRGLQLVFTEEISARFFRYSYAQDVWEYKLRASVRASMIRAMELVNRVESLPIVNQVMQKDRQVRAAVIGGSNSVMRYGWVKGLENSGIRVTENASLGSSSNAILGSRLPEITNTDIDVLFVNTTVNEYYPMRDRIYDVELSRHYIRHVQAWCADRGVLPVYLIYPHRRVLDDLAAGSLVFDQESFSTELCEDMGIPYINVFALERFLAKKWKRNRSSLYRDEAHLNHPTAQVLGAAIGARVWHLIRAQSKDIIRRVDKQPLTHDFSLISLAGVDESFSTRRLKTSIVDKDMITISGKAAIKVPVPEGWEVVGYTMNARRCNASLSLCGENTVIRRADFTGYQGAKGFPFVCSRSLMTPVMPADGVVTLRCEQPALAHEPDEITNSQVPSVDDARLELELQDLIIREKERRRTYLRVDGIPLNLTPEVSLKFAAN